MSEEQVIFRGEFDQEFCFESYGVPVKIRSNSIDLLAEAREIVDQALLRRVRIIENKDNSVKHSFGVASDDRGTFFLFDGGSQITFGQSKENLLKFFNSLVRIKVAEHAKSKVFLHAGVVGWKGKAIVIPASSFKGKTTLVGELVKAGAEYYSDEYAVLDENGSVHPYPRPFSVRFVDGHTREKEVSLELVGAKIGTKAISVGLILITEYEENAKWEPEFLSPGLGMMEIIPHTIPLKTNTEMSLKVLKMIAGRAIIAKGTRGDATQFAKILLSFFDNNVI